MVPRSDPPVNRHRIAAGASVQYQRDVPAEQARRPPLPLLTSLRFFAAAEVVAFHFVTTRPGGPEPSEGVVAGLASGGFAAVAFFFVLSGFILTYVHAGPDAAAPVDVPAHRFWRLRFARLAPAYWAALVLSLPVLLVQLQAGGLPAWAQVGGPLMVLAFVQAWWPPVATLWNMPAWSLSVEVLFYALFPALARFTAPVSPRLLLVVSAAGILFTTWLRREFLSPPGLFPEPTGPFLWQAYFPPLYLPHFLFGMALGRWHLPGAPGRVSRHWLPAVSMILVALFAAASWLPWWTRSDAALMPLFALLILAGATPTPGRSLLALPVLVLLGEASYALYILHLPLRLWWDAAMLMLGVQVPEGLQFAFYFAFATIGSLIALRRIEMPLRRLIAGPGKSGRAR